MPMTHWFQVPGGALADRLGAKNVMTAALGLSALCCLAIPFFVDSMGVSGLWYIMMVMGSVQGPLFPTSTVYLSKWMPKKAALEAGEALIRITIVPAESGESVSTGESTVESRVIEGTPFADGQVETQASGTSEASGWARFKEQVATQARQVAGQVAGAVAGVVASARLIPLHGTRLCAKAVAAKAGCEAQEVVAEPVAAVPETPEPVGEVNRFKQQVFQDFETGRSEIQAAFGYFVGQERTPESQPRLGADVLPAVASTVAGLTVATTLVPLRAARLAVASLTKREGAEGGEGAQPDPTAQQAQPESATSQ
eukprot:g20990.t1